jgi:hypothetical protein
MGVAGSGVFATLLSSLSPAVLPALLSLRAVSSALLAYLLLSGAATLLLVSSSTFASATTSPTGVSLLLTHSCRGRLQTANLQKTCRKLLQKTSAENCRKLQKTAESCRKLQKTAENGRKISTVAESCRKWTPLAEKFRQLQKVLMVQNGADPFFPSKPLFLQTYWYLFYFYEKKALESRPSTVDIFPTDKLCNPERHLNLL